MRKENAKNHLAPSMARLDPARAGVSVNRQSQVGQTPFDRRQGFQIKVACFRELDGVDVRDFAAQPGGQLLDEAVDRSR